MANRTVKPGTNPATIARNVMQGVIDGELQKDRRWALKGTWDWQESTLSVTDAPIKVRFRAANQFCTKHTIEYHGPHGHWQAYVSPVGRVGSVRELFTTNLVPYGANPEHYR